MLREGSGSLCMQPVGCTQWCSTDAVQVCSNIGWTGDFSVYYLMLTSLIHIVWSIISFGAAVVVWIDPSNIIR